MIKADGLALGKVSSSQTHFLRQRVRPEMILGENLSRAEKIVIEEFLEGPRFPFSSFTDGRLLIYGLQWIHKRAGDADTGLNTAGRYNCFESLLYP